MSREQYVAYRHALIASEGLETYLNRQLAGDGLSTTECRILAALAEMPDSRLRMSDLAGDAHHSPSRTSHTVARMEARGWVFRVPGEGDRRVTYVCLTDAGTELEKKATNTYLTSIKRVFIDAIGEEDRPIFDTIAKRVIGATAGASSVVF